MRGLRNNKGQIGRFIESPFVLILLFVIMGLFIAATSMISIRKPDIPEIVSNSLNPEVNSILLQTVELNDRKMFFVDGLISILSGPAERERVEGQMRNDLMQELLRVFQEKDFLKEGECFLITSKKKDLIGASYSLPIFLKKQDGLITSPSFNVWPDKKYTDKLSFVMFIKNLKIDLLTYKGVCL